MSEIVITDLHIERGVQMRSIVECDIGLGWTFEQAVERLAEYLEIDPESVKLAIAIANEYR